MKKLLFGALITVILFSGWTSSTGHASGKDIKLSQPKETLNVDVMQALRQRRSVRSFIRNRPISMDDLASILWAGYGINRPDGKTATNSNSALYYADRIS